MSATIAIVVGLIGFILLPGILIFVLFTPMGWSVTSLAILIGLVYTIYNIYIM